MKIVTLNIRHGGGTRAQNILSYLKAQDADVIVLTEFRENANADIFRSELGSIGYKNFASASIAPKENSVCIASRFPFVPRTYPNLKPKHLHRVMSAHFENLTVFGVYFPQNQAKAEVFKFFINQAHESQDEPHLIVGDFNTGIHELDECRVKPNWYWHALRPKPSRHVMRHESEGHSVRVVLVGAGEQVILQPRRRTS